MNKLKQRNGGPNARERRVGETGPDAATDPVRGEHINGAAANVTILAALHQIMGFNSRTVATDRAVVLVIPRIRLPRVLDIPALEHFDRGSEGVNRVRLMYYSPLQPCMCK
jgi:hypothetical protein